MLMLRILTTDVITSKPILTKYVALAFRMHLDVENSDRILEDLKIAIFHVAFKNFCEEGITINCDFRLPSLHFSRNTTCPTAKTNQVIIRMQAKGMITK